ncbi:MAG: hypothetical protein HY222_01625 [Thaumarchaeota archaeon]|nr:hypothetical protein [Nitrososphaerota archaeon]MBI3641074.1 hypothetical protein [Nitrososphaerota archaeon]
MSDFDINVIFDEIKEFTPETGFNLVGIDCFEFPGEKIYLIGHFDTREEAKKEQAKYDKNRTAIYHK